MKLNLKCNLSGDLILLLPGSQAPPEAGHFLSRLISYNYDVNNICWQLLA